MGFRFFKRQKLVPGLTLNLCRSGGSISFGPKGAKFTIGPNGKQATLGLPGTGLFYTVRMGGKKDARKAEAPPAPTVPPDQRLDLGFFKRLITPDDEEELVDGLREYVGGDEEKAMEHLRRALHLADAAFMAGVLALKKDQLEEAFAFLSVAARQERELGRYFKKYGVSLFLSIDVTDEVSAHVGPDPRGALLALVEACQRQKKWQEAIECFQRLKQLDPDDIIVRLSLAELKMEAWPGDRQVYQEVVQMTEDLPNETALHSALLLYRIRSLREMGLWTAARKELAVILKEKKDRPAELLQAFAEEQELIDAGARAAAR